MSDINKIISDHMRSLGKKGGATTRERYGKEHFSQMAKSRKGSTWTWNPAKKGKRKKKAEGLQKEGEGDMIPTHVKKV